MAAYENWRGRRMKSYEKHYDKHIKTWNLQMQY